MNINLKTSFVHFAKWTSENIKSENNILNQWNFVCISLNLIKQEKKKVKPASSSYIWFYIVTNRTQTKSLATLTVYNVGGFNFKYKISNKTKYWQ